jgi:D-aspartate ligase
MRRNGHGTAIVVDVGWVNGLGAIRSLGRHGVRVLAVDHRPWALGFRSRYAEPVVAPDVLEDEDGFVATLARLAERLEAPLPIFPTHDEHLNALARHASELRSAYRFPFPSWEVLEPIQDKRHQLEQAEAIGLATPQTAHPNTAAEAIAAGAELGYPVFVKPARPIRFKQLHGRQGFRCNTPGELEAAYAHMAEFEPMVQEFVPGGDDALFTLGAYIAADGEELAVFSGRKLRQTREFMGSCRVGESLWVDQVVDEGLRLLHALDFHGIAQVETKRDPRDGRYKLIEVNPRLWQWHGLGGVCGVDIAWIAYRDLIGERLPPARMRENGKRWAIAFMPGQTHALQRPPYVDGVFAPDDPGPGLVQAGRYARRVGSRLGLETRVERPRDRVATP